MGHRKTSTITSKFASFFKEAVKAPPAPPPEPEPTPEEPELPPLTTHTDEWEETEIEEETTRMQAEAPNVLDELNSATQRWKETGESGMHLEAPVPLSERAKKVWDKIAHDVSPKVANALKNKIEVVAQTANTKLHQIQMPTFERTRNTTATAPPTPPLPQKPETTLVQPTVQPQATPKQNTPPTTPVSPEQLDNAIISSWMEVLKKTEENATPAEREEIEKLYKQLSQ